MSTTTDRIEADLDQTRHALHDTIEALGNKLSPGQMLDEVIGLAKGQTGAFVANLGRGVRDNPLPILLIAGGIAWLAANRYGGGSHAVVSADDWDLEERYRRVEQARWSTPRNAGESDDDYHNRLHDAHSTALQLKQNAGEAMDAFKQRVRDAVSSLEQRAAATRQRIGAAFSGAVHYAQDQARHAGHFAHHQAERAAAASKNAVHSAENFYEANPLATGAIALGIGALLGSVVPLSNTERDTLGDVADKAARAGGDLADRAARAGADLVERGAHAVEERAATLQ